MLYMYDMVLQIAYCSDFDIGSILAQAAFNSSEPMADDAELAFLLLRKPSSGHLASPELLANPEACIS